MNKFLRRSSDKMAPYRIGTEHPKKLKLSLKVGKANDPARRVNTEAYDKADTLQNSRGRSHLNFNDRAGSLLRSSQKQHIPTLPFDHNLHEQKPLMHSKFLVTLNRFSYENKAEPHRKNEPKVLTRKDNRQSKKIRPLHTESIEREDKQLRADHLSEFSRKFADVSVTKERQQERKISNPEMLYRVDEVIGKGTFGVVYKATKRDNGKSVAIKKVLQDKRYKNRELQILKMLHHPNVLEIWNHYFTVEEGGEYLNVVMEYFEETLYSLNKKYLKNFTNVPPLLVKIYSYQFFRALNYLSSISISHRDIKPYNILVDPQSNRAVICDFGSAKQLVSTQTNIAYICSRCYRAPELIFGATDYTAQIDMWSIGCVMVELINGEPPFMGESQNDQLVEIIKVLGTPSKEAILAMNKQYDVRQYNFPNIKAKEWKKILRSKTDPLLVDLITEIMEYSPAARITPFEAMCHPYFDDLRIESKYKEIHSKVKCPDLYNYNKEELSSHKKFADKLLPAWYKGAFK